MVGDLRFPACLRMRLQFDSPSMAVFGGGRMAKLSSACSLKLDHFCSFTICLITFLGLLDQFFSIHPVYQLVGLLLP